MGLIHRHDPKGIDVGIIEVQKELFIELTNRGWTSYDSFDRAYRNKKGADKIPEVYTDNGEYKEVLINDTKTATSFFLADEKRTYDFEKCLYSQGISIIFQANTKKLYPNVKHQPDEELIDTIRQAIKKKYWENRLVQITTGFENVYNSLKLSYNNKDFADMGDFNIARFDFKMLYSNTNEVKFIK